MADDREWIVPGTLARPTERCTPPAGGTGQRAAGVTAPRWMRAERVHVLRERIRRGHYASEAMMDVVARRLLDRGDL